MDNIYRRDHEMAYISDDAVVAQQKETKKAVREYNEAMPFDPEKGMEYLERTGLKHKKNVYFEPPFHCEYGSHSAESSCGKCGSFITGTPERGMPVYPAPGRSVRGFKTRRKVRCLNLQSAIYPYRGGSWTGAGGKGP